jgi:MoaA/NifB/PqqE/SkfB family radical SAM enzyme
MTAVEIPTRFVWLHLTDLCQLECVHCATDSSPSGTHGRMTTDDWIRVLDETRDAGVRRVQFVGGEPTLHPGLPELIDHALTLAVDVEVFSNLVRVPPALWEVFAQPGVSLATSYYSDDPAEHAAVTGRPSHARTRANIAKAVSLGIDVRAGVIDLGGTQRVEGARRDLVDLGVPSVGHDEVRELGRGARAGQRSAAQLCGRCGDGIAAVDPSGEVRPCLFARWVSAGNVLHRPLPRILADMPSARAALAAAGMVVRPPQECTPVTTGTDCYPHSDRLTTVGGPCSPTTTGANCYPHTEFFPT